MTLSSHLALLATLIVTISSASEHHSPINEEPFYKNPSNSPSSDSLVTCQNRFDPLEFFQGQLENMHFQGPADIGQGVQKIPVETYKSEYDSNPGPNSTHSQNLKKEKPHLSYPSTT